MNTALGIIAAFLTSILFSGAAIAAMLVGGCALVGGTCWWLLRQLGRTGP